MYFIAKVLFTMMFWVVLARWGYSEVAQLSPTLRKSIDVVLEVAVIPTHDRWDFQAIKEGAQSVVEVFAPEQAYAGEQEF